jgi:penicillin-binding protein 1A
MKADGFSEEEIIKVFNQKVQMKVFTWNGTKDTVMSPWDSLVYHKWFLHSGMMSVEPQTGHVKAYVGGINYQYFKFDNVVQGKRQVGSTFKPFVYLVAMQSGLYNPCSKVPNIEVCFENVTGDGTTDWCPKNSDKKREGEMVTLKWALANSVNFVSAYLMKEFRPQAIVKQVHKMGVKSEIPEVPAICLGSCDLSVYEMVGAFATFVNQGVYSEPIFITKIEDKRGNVLATYSSPQSDAMNPESAYMMVKLMQGVVDGGTGGRLRFVYKLDGDIAGKTGTTQNQSDGWFMGSIPRLTTGVWVGGEMRSIHFRSISQGQGAAMALPIWGLYTQKLYKDKELGYSSAEKFKSVEGVVQQFDCTASDDESEKSVDTNNEDI